MIQLRLLTDRVEIAALAIFHEELSNVRFGLGAEHLSDRLKDLSLSEQDPRLNFSQDYLVVLTKLAETHYSQRTFILRPLHIYATQSGLFLHSNVTTFLIAGLQRAYLLLVCLNLCE
jgi:hypothetical protein